MFHNIWKWKPVDAKNSEQQRTMHMEMNGVRKVGHVYHFPKLQGRYEDTSDICRFYMQVLSFYISQKTDKPNWLLRIVIAVVLFLQPLKKSRTLVISDSGHFEAAGDR